MPILRALVRRSEIDALALAQGGAIGRPQAIAAGMSPSQLTYRVNTGRWQRVHPGVFVVYAGPLTYVTRAWAALLYVGERAALGLETAAYLWGLSDAEPAAIDVIIPGDRRVDHQPGLRIHIRGALPARMHPARQPPMTRVEDTVLDLVERARSVESVVGLVTRACQRRLTTASRLAAAMDARKKMRWRRVVSDILEDVRDGVASALERAWRRAVEQRHGLPQGERNRHDAIAGGARYRDIGYRELAMIVELDGRAAHPDDERHRDMRRDNAVAEDGVLTLRYGWADVVGDPCAVAMQFARIAQQRGWRGRPRSCGPGCLIDQFPFGS